MDPGSTTGQDERYELASEAKPSLHTWCSDQPEGTHGMVYSSKGIAAIIMPGIMGIIADKWLRAERAYMLCHLVCAGVLFYAQ